MCMWVRGSGGRDAALDDGNGLDGCYRCDATPTQGATAEANGMATCGGQHARVAAKRSHSESSNSTVVQNSMVDGVATKLDARQALEAEIRQAMQATAQGQAEGRFMIRDGQRHLINPRNRFVSDWPVGHSGCFLCGDDHRFEHCSRRDEQGGKARFHANFGAHRPEHIKRVKLLAKPTDCGKRTMERIDRNI
eukprot:scaffold280983_cov71-Attheya_sp.AAC.1